jgi:hypothetical protein
MVEDPANVARFLAAVGEATEVPRPSPGRAVPRTGIAACFAGRPSVRRTKLRAAGCRRPRSRTSLVLSTFWHIPITKRARGNWEGTGRPSVVPLLWESLLGY